MLKNVNYFPFLLVFAGLVGLSLSYALTLTSTQIFVTRWYCNLSNYIVSVERIKQFMHIPSEPPAIVEGRRPPSSWPSKGRIELQALKVRKLILENLHHEFKCDDFVLFFLLVSDKISSNCSISSQGDYLHIQRRD